MLVTPKFTDPTDLPLPLAQGVYEIYHHNGNFELNRTDGWCENYDYDYPKLHAYKGEWFGSYGVCDNYQQILDQCATLTDPTREFVVFLTPVCRDEQSDWGGWRWHKWGEYIGTETPTTEYLYDEPDIDQVYTYSILERNTAVNA